MSSAVGTTGAERQAAYAQWRAGLRAKSEERRARGQRSFGGSQADRSGDALLFDETLLFRMSDYARMDDANAIAEADPATHLAVLDLRESATREEILAAYRSLAKMHHPDRWVTGNQATRGYHERCMGSINDAYQALHRMAEHTDEAKANSR